MVHSLHDLQPDEQPDRFLLARYADGGPGELIVSRLEDRAAVQRALSAANGRRIAVTTPPCSRTAQDLLKLCALNHAYRTRPTSPIGGP